MNGPGQNNSAKESKKSGLSVYMLFLSWTCTIRGSLKGLLLALKIFNIA